MKEIIVGSNDSRSYLSSSSMLSRLWHSLFFRTQSKNIFEQLETTINGIKISCFDLVISFNQKTLKWEFANKRFRYKSNYTLFDILDILQKENKDIYVRLSLGKISYMEDNEGFTHLCNYLEKNYPKIRFFGGCRIKDNKQLYKFDSNIAESDIHLWVASSMEDSKWYEKALPKLYSRRRNKENYLKIKPGINLFDFV